MDQLSLNTNDLNFIIDAYSIYVIKLDLNNYDCLKCDDISFYEINNFIKNIFPKCSVKQLKLFLKKSNNRVLFLKILLDIDQIHCIMFLVE
jgi:hypothetical protein